MYRGERAPPGGRVSVALGNSSDPLPRQSVAAELLAAAAEAKKAKDTSIPSGLTVERQRGKKAVPMDERFSTFSFGKVSRSHFRAF